MSEETGRMSEEDKFLGVKTAMEPPQKNIEASQGDMFDEVEVEVVDDRPVEDRRDPDPTLKTTDGDLATDQEIEAYGKRAFNRMKKLKLQFHEERRAKETAERLSGEAVSYTNNLQTENQRLLKLVQDTQKALNEHSKYGASTAVAMATENFKKAHESGDADEIAAAQQALTKAQLAEASAPTVSQRVIDNWKQQVLAEQREAQRTQPRVDLPPSEVLDPQQVEWQDNNPWFGSDKEMTSFAYGVHEKLVVDEGIDPKSQQYYELVDNRMREVFPSYFGSGNKTVVAEAASRPRANPVVAPAARSNGASPRKVVLTSTQVALAERLGITPQQYAQQLIKETVV